MTISNILQIDFAGIDDSDSASSSGVEDHNGLEDEEMSDEEDIPLSDLEDLDDEDKEDMIPHQRLTINNTTALSTALRRIALPLKTFQFTDHQSLTTSEPVIIADVSDDLNRELAFYKQSLEAVTEARALLKKEGAPFSRPTDYFAEMVKADEHMAKIKAKLVEAAAGKKASAEARKQRDLKKFGKQVQVAKLQERQKEKTATMEKIKVLKRSMSPSGPLRISPLSILTQFANHDSRAPRRRSPSWRHGSRPLRRRARQRGIEARAPRPQREAQQARQEGREVRLRRQEAPREVERRAHDGRSDGLQLAEDEGAEQARCGEGEAGEGEAGGEEVGDGLEWWRKGRGFGIASGVGWVVRCCTITTEIACH